MRVKYELVQKIEGNLDEITAFQSDNPITITDVVHLLSELTSAVALLSIHASGTTSEPMLNDLTARARKMQRTLAGN